MATYRVITPIRHNGTRHEPPAVVEMDEQDAAPHLAAGVLTPVVGVEVAVSVDTDAAAVETPETKPKRRAKGADK